MTPLPDRPMLRPLLEAEMAIAWLSDITGRPLDEVRHSVAREQTRLGQCVRQELRDRGLPPFEWSAGLAVFYEQSQAFLFESLVWNSTSKKQGMRDWIVRALRARFPEGANILCFGDGLGFDSAEFARAGHRVTYHEVGRPCVRFAKHVFEANGVTVAHCDNLSSLPAASFDVVVCLDVLEHVPDPPALVQTLTEVMCPGGWLIAHAPFWYLHADVATHLRSNARYSGDWRTVYGRSGLRPIDAAAFWCPLVLAKDPTAKPDTWLAAARIRFSQVVLVFSRYWTWPLVTGFKTLCPLRSQLRG